MERKGCYDYAIDSRDIDYANRARFTAMCHYILQAAGEDADRNGFGVRDLNVGNSSWVLSRVAMEFYCWPEHYDAFTVRTWVNDVSRVMTTRNMIVTGADGRKIAGMVTQWAIIDLDKRSALDIRGNFDCSKVITDEPSPIDNPVRIARVEPQGVTEHKVVYSDIDFNRHVSSMKYLEWMMDMLPVDKIDKYIISRVDIHFLHEGRYGEVLKIGWQPGEKDIFEVTGPDGTPLCRAAFAWKERG